MEVALNGCKDIANILDEVVRKHVSEATMSLDFGSWDWRDGVESFIYFCVTMNINWIHTEAFHKLLQSIYEGTVYW